MSTFAFYNYQFAKILSPIQGDLFSNEPLPDPNRSFARKQEILSELFKSDYEGTKPIRFSSVKGDKVHRHLYLTPFADDMAVIRIQNPHTDTEEMKDFCKGPHTKYPTCVVVIDNRPGIQRIVIEQRRKAFYQPRQVQDILQTNLRNLLRPYGLTVSIDQLHTREAFWNVVNDVRQYPEGFRTISFYLPPLNLERLRKSIGHCLTMARETFDSDLSWSQSAPQGGRLPIDKNNKRQVALIETMLEDVGGDNAVKLMPNGKGMKEICVGQDNYRTAHMDMSVIRKLESDDSAEREKAMNYIKMFTKRFTE